MRLPGFADLGGAVSDWWLIRMLSIVRRKWRREGEDNLACCRERRCKGQHGVDGLASQVDGHAQPRDKSGEGRVKAAGSQPIGQGGCLKVDGHKCYVIRDGDACVLQSLALFMLAGRLIDLKD